MILRTLASVVIGITALTSVASPAFAPLTHYKIAETAKPQPPHQPKTAIVATTKPSPAKTATAVPVQHQPELASRSASPVPTVLYDGYAELTAYTGIDGTETGDDITASGTHATAGRTVAAWDGIPFGSRVYVPELGKTFVVEDRGGAITYGHIDVYVGHSNVNDAYAFGRKKLQIIVYAPN